MLSRMVLVGQPGQQPSGHRRMQGLRAALARHGLPPPRVFDYVSVLASPDEFLDAAADAIAVKLDSPGADDVVHDAFVRRGLTCFDGTQAMARMRGELVDMHLRFAGFADLLRQLAETLPGARWLNAPDDILRMCDKWHCQQALAAAGVETPAMLGLVEGHDHLQSMLDASSHDRVFVKARFGSSAAGVVAYRRHRDGRSVACTTAGMQEVDGRPRLFNRLRLQRYTRASDIAALIDALAMQGAYAEAWVAKPRASNDASRNFDLRVVSGNGEARQRVARLSNGPMTNLHLGNRRDGIDALLDADANARVEHAVRSASAAFPHSRSIGFDLIPLRERCVFLEANAFGDDLQDVTWQGRDAWDDQVAWAYALPSPQQVSPAKRHAHA
ncbi:STM4014 family protein [Lysobacter brunescens]|uniref:STM4014 family protein n=1 Tax=Lysobacter brunescens TaxID=262323 RepID=A0ABW2YCK0_9GAMM